MSKQKPVAIVADVNAGPDNPTGIVPEENKSPGLPPMVPLATLEALQKEHSALQTHHSIYSPLVGQAILDAKAFINQCDREGLGMQTVTDHRKRVESFLAKAQKGGLI